MKKKTYEVKLSLLEAKVNERKNANGKEVIKYIKELEDKNVEISTFKQELEIMKKKTYEVKCLQLEAKVEDAKEELKHKSQEYENLLEKLRSKVKENEALSESKYQKWTMIENQIRKAVNFQFSFIQINLHIDISDCQSYCYYVKYFNFLLNLQTFRN